jgi:hypothetical protein
MPLGFHLPFLCPLISWRIAAQPRIARDRLLTQALAGL